MAKFLDKKTRVIDFKLTPHGKQKLSIGKFKPIYYQFFDDGILYDSECGAGAGDESPVAIRGGPREAQNKTNQRIKDETQFLESLVSFTDIGVHQYSLEDYRIVAKQDTTMAMEDIAIAAPTVPIATDKFSYESGLADIISDNENSSYSPATRLITCQGEIIKISDTDDTVYDRPGVPASIDVTKQSISEREHKIPQINVDLYYTLVIGKPSSIMDANDVYGVIDQTPPFSDGNVVKLMRDDLVVYFDEVNTELLKENYDIEVYEIIDNAESKTLKRKYFQNKEKQIVDGFMTHASHLDNKAVDYTKDSVEYWFEVLTDLEISDRIACGCASAFNKESFYIETDHDCEKIKETQELYYDIYGSVTVPEICDPLPGTNPQGDPINEDLEKTDAPDCED